jgi:hypothetical protein
MQQGGRERGRWEGGRDSEGGGAKEGETAGGGEGGRGEGGRERGRGRAEHPYTLPTPPLSMGFKLVKGGRKFKRLLLFNMAGSLGQKRERYRG